VQLGFSAAARELEAWLVGCHARLQAQAARGAAGAAPAPRRGGDSNEEARRAPMCRSRAHASVPAGAHLPVPSQCVWGARLQLMCGVRPCAGAVTH